MSKNKHRNARIRPQLQALDDTNTATWTTGILLACANVVNEMLIAEGWEPERARAFVEKMIPAASIRFGELVSNLANRRLDRNNPDLLMTAAQGAQPEDESSETKPA